MVASGTPGTLITIGSGLLGLVGLWVREAAIVRAGWDRRLSVVGYVSTIAGERL
jgi:hypothetical protein